MSTSIRICDEPRCGRPTHGFSSWCTKHASRAYMHGSPKMKHGVREGDLKPFGDWVSEGLARYRNTKASEAALKLAEDILNYKATNGYTFQRELQRMMGILRDDQVTASDILHRVCLMVAFASAAPGRYSGSTKAENLAMGRMIMRLAPLQRRGKRYAARSVHLLGEMARDYLYVFGLKLHERLKLDAEKVHELKKLTLDFDTAAEVAPDAPRAGVRHRNCRGVQVP
jgi:hypothetical protein